MPGRRPPNPNTKYGRKRMRDEAAYRISQYTPEERAEYNKVQAIFYVCFFVVVVIIFLIIYATAGPEAAVKWLR